MRNVILLSFLVMVVLGGFMAVGGQNAFAESELACKGNDPNNPCLPNPLTPTGQAMDRPEELYGRVIRAFLVFVGIGSLVAFVFAGALFVFAGGNQERVKKARDSMVYAVVGIAVSLGSYVILSFVIEALKGTLG